MSDFTDKDDDFDAVFICIMISATTAEFVWWTIWMVYEMKTQNVGEFAYFVSHRHGFSKYVSTNVPVGNSPVRTPLQNNQLIA